MMRSSLLLLLLAHATGAWAQTATPTANERIELLNADRGEYDDRIAPGAQRLKGDVRFRHKDAVLRCDSAYLYNDQQVRAFGHVTIAQGDTLHVQADRALYNGNERTARLEGNVTMRNSDMELNTSALHYDLRGRRAVYDTGGRIRSVQGGDVLTSDHGIYLTNGRRFIFSRNVRIDHPERTITGDTMHYVTSTGVAEFPGPTRIVHGSTIINTLRGTYDTRNERARFTKRSVIDDQGRTLEGDSLHYDRRTGEGSAWGQVVVNDSASATTIRGALGRYNSINDRAMVTGQAELELRMGTDTLFLHGDTLFTLPSDNGDRIQAHRHVRFFRNDLQGACDTLIYDQADSVISLYHAPVLWSGTDQITGRHIRIALRDGKAHQLFIEQAAFLVSQVDSIRYDQVAGTNMTGYFGDQGLRTLEVEGNARTVYFAQETKNGEEHIMGVNRADCSRIHVHLKDGKVETVTFLDRPDATLYPLEKAPADELRMQGSDWRAAERPMDRAGIFLTPTSTTP
jgi:lipopolysaccharide export system protein LptA